MKKTIKNYLKKMKGGAEFIKENFPTGAKSIGRSVIKALSGGKYGENMEKFYSKTPEGTEIMKSLKEKGFFQTLKEHKEK